MSGVGICEHCNRAFDYRLIHNGFNDSAFAYCNSCGCLAILSHWSKWPKEAVPGIGGIKPEIEAYLSPCSCGGRFRADAAPRCPHCHQILCAEKAAAYIEANAPGTAKGWRWQRSWNGNYALYAVMIEGRVVHDPWRSSKV
jgi:hypothetical protein